MPGRSIPRDALVYTCCRNDTAIATKDNDEKEYVLSISDWHKI